MLGRLQPIRQLFKMINVKKKQEQETSLKVLFAQIKSEKKRRQ